MYNFIKQKYIELERGVVYELSKRGCYINRFLTKRRLKDPKMKKLPEENPKINRKKSRGMCRF